MKEQFKEQIETLKKAYQQFNYATNRLDIDSAISKIQDVEQKIRELLKGVSKDDRAKLFSRYVFTGNSLHDDGSRFAGSQIDKSLQVIQNEEEACGESVHGTHRR